MLDSRAALCISHPVDVREQIAPLDANHLEARQIDEAGVEGYGSPVRSRPAGDRPDALRGISGNPNKRKTNRALDSHAGIMR